MHYKCTNIIKRMSFNYFQAIKLGEKRVKRSSAPVHSNPFALVTDVTAFSRFDVVTATMKKAAQSMPDPYYLHFRNYFDDPADAVKIVPTVLQSFNRSRTLRRQCISGIRMCNLYSHNFSWYYVSDMVLQSAFDTCMMCAGLADFSNFGSHILLTVPIPRSYYTGGLNGKRRFANMCERIFWNNSYLQRSSVGFFVEAWQDSFLIVRLEPHGLSHVSVLSYVLRAFHEFKGVKVAVGMGDRLIVSRDPLWNKGEYQIYQPDKALARFRYRHASAFGKYHNNPDYLLY